MRYFPMSHNNNMLQTLQVNSKMGLQKKRDFDSMVKEMLPSYSILVFNKINPTTNDGVDIIKCTFCDLSYIPVELKSMNRVYIESTDFSNIRHNQKVGSIHCSSCSRVKISRVCGERSVGNGAASDPEERNANFIKVERGDLCSARLVSMANCRSENTDGITILEIEMNITSTNCSYNEALESALRLQNTMVRGTCSDSTFINNIGSYDRSLKRIAMENMFRCVYNSKLVKECSIRFHEANSILYDCLIIGSRSGIAFSSQETLESSCSLHRCQIEGSTNGIATEVEPLKGTIKEFLVIINCGEYEGNLNNLNNLKSKEDKRRECGIFCLSLILILSLSLLPLIPNTIH